MGTGYAMREKSARDFLTPLYGGCTAHSSLMDDRVRPLSIHRPASKRGEFTGSTRTWWLRCDLRNGRRRVSCDSPAFKASEPTNAHATSCGNSRSPHRSTRQVSLARWDASRPRALYRPVPELG